MDRDAAKRNKPKKGTLWMMLMVMMPLLGMVAGWRRSIQPDHSIESQPAKGAA